MPKVMVSSGNRWRLWLRVATWCMAAASTAFATREIRRFAFTDPRFALKDVPARDMAANGIVVEGARYASRARLIQVFAPDFGHSVFKIPLAERRRRLLAVDWVEEASVSRIWPNRLVVRIRERTPVAFANLHTGFLLVDAQGVLLAPPLKTRFALPVISGLTVDQPEEERRTRVQTMLHFMNELGRAADSVSEVHVEDPSDLHATVQMKDRAVELWMGDQNYTSRYQNFISHYEQIRNRSETVSTFDLRIDGSIITK
ncbi:MAG TPA: hypothetical protein DEQ47_20200 [Solibacterales bacterium]|nr:hypothetical protein [Bryobacterales bacterium]